jgi:hypothetical protein
MKVAGGREALCACGPSLQYWGAAGRRALAGGSVPDRTVPIRRATLVFANVEELPSRFATTIAAAAVGGFVLAAALPVAAPKSATPRAGAELRLGTRFIDD